VAALGTDADGDVADGKVDVVVDVVVVGGSLNRMLA
jgi:hypothetical protein